MDGNSMISVAVTMIAALLVYAVLARGLQKAGDTFRERALSLYEKLINSHEANPTLIARVESNMDEVFSTLEAWRWAGIMFCVVFFIVPYRKIRGGDMTVEPDGIPPSLRKDFSRFTTMTMLATITNSPLAASIFVLCGLVGFAFSVPMKMLGKLLVSHDDMHKHRPA